MAQRFTLLDDQYFHTLEVVAAALEAEGLPFCLVGGGAAQAWIASLRTDDGARGLSDEPVLSSALRKTRDLDFSTRAQPDRVLRLANELVATQAGGGQVLGPRALRLGQVSVAFTLEPSDLSGMETMYDEFLDRRTLLRLRRGSRLAEIPVIALEDLLVTKLTRRGDKAKDIADVTQLLAAATGVGRTIDLAAVRRMLANRPEAQELLVEIERMLVGEDGG
jgi:hypothetical protein